MTELQLKHANLVEEARANRANEELKDREVSTKEAYESRMAGREGLERKVLSTSANLNETRERAARNDMGDVSGLIDSAQDTTKGGSRVPGKGGIFNTLHSSIRGAMQTINPLTGLVKILN